MTTTVITGIGPVTAIGIGRIPFGEAVRAGRSGIVPIASFVPRSGSVQEAGEIRDFSVEDYLESRKNYLDRASELALAAMALALEDADLDPQQIAGEETDLCLGTAFGSLATMGLFFRDYVEKGPRFVKPVLFPHAYSNTAISLLAMEYGLCGHHAGYASGRISSSCAIAAAFDRIRLGRAGLACAGGTDAFHEIVQAGRPDGGCGDALGEGAVLLVLESEARARARGARIAGLLAGVGQTADFRFEEAMRLALAEAGWRAEEVDQVHLSSCGRSGLADREREAAARTAPSAKTVFVTAQTGDTLGASGAVQLAAALVGTPDGGNGGSRRCLVFTSDPGGDAVCLAVQGVDA